MFDLIEDRKSVKLSGSMFAMCRAETIFSAMIFEYFCRRIFVRVLSNVTYFSKEAEDLVARNVQSVEFQVSIQVIDCLEPLATIIVAVIDCLGLYFEAPEPINKIAKHLTSSLGFRHMAHKVLQTLFLIFTLILLLDASTGLPGRQVMLTSARNSRLHLSALARQIGRLSFT